jgi:hypothetical protein
MNGTNAPPELFDALIIPACLVMAWLVMIVGDYIKNRQAP